MANRLVHRPRCHGAAWVATAALFLSPPPVRIALIAPDGLDWSPGSPVPFPEAGAYVLRLAAEGRTANAKLVFVH